MRQDLVADAFSVLKNAEKVGKKEVLLPSNKVIRETLRVMKGEGYIGGFEYVEDKRGFKVTLVGKINDCKAIRPRFAIKAGEFEKWEMRFLPAKGFGILIISTSKGIMTQEEARVKNLGGRLVAFVY